MMLLLGLSVCESEHGVGEGMDGGCMPLPTHPQRYCDPASRVLTMASQISGGGTEIDFIDDEIMMMMILMFL